jgi:uncharacterized protein (TIGR00266 family)
MEHEILYRDAYPVARIRLSAGESITAVAEAMVSMSEGITIETSTGGGMLSGLKRRLAGVSLFINTFHASSGGVVDFAPPLPGDIMHLALAGGTMFVGSGSYLASSGGISVDTQWAGAKGLFAKEGLFLIKVQGTGGLFLSGYGTIHEQRLGTGESQTIDNGYLVAFDEGVTWKLRRVGGLKSTLFSGEGLVCSYTGPGRVLMQTRSHHALIAWLRPYMYQYQHSSGQSQQ